jgi:hypothetical protein
MGRDAAGPYFLTWKNIEPGSTILTMNGRRMVPGLDYNTDPANGTVQFSKPLKSSAVVRVDYRFQPGISTRNSTGNVVPLSLKILDGRTGSFQLDTLFRPPSGGTSNPSDLGAHMLLSLGGGAKVAGSSLQARFFMDAQGGALDYRNALSITDSIKLSNTDVSLKYNRAGRKFAASQETGIAAGQALLETVANTRLKGGWLAGMRFSQNEILPETGRGDRVETLGQSLSGPLSKAARLQFNRLQTDVTAADGTRSSRTNARFLVDTILRPGTTAQAYFDRTDTAAASSTSVDQTTGVNLRSQIRRGIVADTSFSSTLRPGGNEDTTRIRLDATYLPRTKVTLTSEDRLTRDEARRLREAGLEYSVRPGITLTGGYQLRSDNQSERTAGTIGASLRPVPSLEVGGSIRLRNVDARTGTQPDAVDTYTAQGSLRLLGDALRLSGQVAENPEDTAGNIARLQRYGVGLQSRVGSFDVGGSFSRERALLAGSENRTYDFSLGWRIAAATSLSTGFRETLLFGAANTGQNIYSLNLSHRVGSLLDLLLGGTVTRSFQNGVYIGQPEVMANARLGIRF